MSFARKIHRVTAANKRQRRIRGKLSLRTGLRAGAATLASGAVIAAAGLATAGPAGAATLGASHHARYTFATLNNQHDPAFNQLLGINNQGVIAGYFGSGAAGHPNKGYRLLPPYSQGDYANENFPGSAQTQVTGLNDGRTQVGFFAPPTPAPMPTSAGTPPITGAASTRSPCRTRPSGPRRLPSSSG